MDRRTMNFDETCSIFNSISEAEMIAFFSEKLPVDRQKEIESWLENNDDLKEAFEGFKFLVDSNPGKSFNNFFQKAKEDFITSNALLSVLNKKE